MRADQRRSLHRTILTAAVLLLSASAVAAQTTYYGPGGDYLGQGTWRRNTATFYDAKGNFVGSSVASPGRSTNAAPLAAPISPVRWTGSSSRTRRRRR